MEEPFRTAGLPPLHTGGNINGRVIALKLGGKQELPEPKSYAGMPIPPKATEDEASVQEVNMNIINIVNSVMVQVQLEEDLYLTYNRCQKKLIKSSLE